MKFPTLQAIFSQFGTTFSLFIMHAGLEIGRLAPETIYGLLIGWNVTQRYDPRRVMALGYLGKARRSASRLVGGGGAGAFMGKEKTLLTFRRAGFGFVNLGEGRARKSANRKLCARSVWHFGARH